MTKIEQWLYLKKIKQNEEKKGLLCLDCLKGAWIL